MEYWQCVHENSVICIRELGNTDVPHVNQEWITAAFKPLAERSDAETKALITSDEYIAELRQADVIVIGAPMYNWSVPSTLKAYIDQVLRVNETFRYDRNCRGHPYTGLLKDKMLVLLVSRGDGGYEQGEHNAHMNFQSTYLKRVFNIMGVHDIRVISINGTSLTDEKLNQSIIEAEKEIRILIQPEWGNKP
jgi:FMN-dependent NADH-azoreductase